MKKLRDVTLSIRIPGFGSNFRVGTNCSEIELDDGVYVIREPREEAKDMRSTACADIVVGPRGWGFVQPTVRPTFACPDCSELFATEQALGGHRFHKHQKRSDGPRVVSPAAKAGAK